MALTLSGTNGVVGVGFTLDASGASVTAGVGTFSSLQGSAASLTQIPAANIVGVCTAGLGNASGAFGQGKILQVVSTTKTDTASNSTSSNTFWDYTAFNAQITTTGSNKVLVQVSVSYAVTNANRISMRLRKDGATVSGAVGSSVSSRTAVTSAELHDYGGSLVTTNSFVYLDSPSAGTHTYNIAFKHSSGSTKTLYINRSPDDNDNYSYFRPVSTITLMEVAA